MEDLTPANEQQEELEKQPEKKQISSKKLLRTLLLLVFIGSFTFSLIKIAAKLYAYHKEDMAYKEVRESIQTNNQNNPTTAQKPSYTVEEPDPSDNAEVSLTLPYTVLKGNPDELNKDGIFNIYSALKAQNSDLVGWISMPGFQKVIDYPVMQSYDNDFYMTHDFYKNKSNSGSIFMDFANKISELDRNIVLYGHAMRNNSMFGNLRGYHTDQEKYGNITTIYLDLLNMHLEYQVFSAYSTESDFNYRRTFFSDDADYLSFLNTITNKSEQDFGVPLTVRDKIITLSTCDKNYGNDGRIAIHAKLVKQIIYDDSSIEGEYTEADGSDVGNLGNDKKIITSNVYLEKLQLQYQVSDADTTQAPEASPAPATSTSPSTPLSPATSPSPTPSPSPETSKPVVWQDVILDPPFATANALFSAKVPNTAALAKITVKAYDSKARISFTINDKNADPEKLELIEGENIIIVRVLSADGLYVRKYTINVIKEPVPGTPTPQPEQTPTPSPEQLP